MTNTAQPKRESAHPHKEPRDWSIAYRKRLFSTDVLVVVWAVFGSQIAWFGATENNVAISGRLANLPISYTAVSAALSVAWIAFLSGSASRDSRIVGIGTAEYRRITNASLMLFGFLAIACYLLKAELGRGYFFTALPVGVLALLFSRWTWRQWLVAKRASGSMSSRVVLVGSVESAVHTFRELQRLPAAGYLVVGAVIPDGREHTLLGATTVPVLGNISSASRAVDAVNADTVIVTSSNELSPTGLQRLSWSLEPGRRHLVVAPGLTDIAGPRIHTRPVAGLSLIHVETPRYKGFSRIIKRIFDILASFFLISISIVPLTVIALLVKSSSAGPVIFRQSRIGQDGLPFSMLKFRSMFTDAEQRLDDLDAKDDGAGNDVMFKLQIDPRVTSVGRYLRRFSLDELPQLFNVLAGTMSLVGPRPSLASEVEQYETHVNRRFLVTPGITGLWQVSGRSDLSWEESVRLDLFYVENWSLLSDFSILWRTAKAVVSRRGAY